MELATITTDYVCGVDIHSKTMYICVMNRKREIKLHKHMQNDFNLFKLLKKIYGKHISVGVEPMHSYYWLTDELAL